MGTLLRVDPVRSKEWMRSKAFVPPNSPNPARYNESLETFFLSVSTNVREVYVTGHSLGTTQFQIRELVGCTTTIGLYASSRLRMFRAQSTRVSIESDNITRLDDNMVSHDLVILKSETWPKQST